MNSSFRVIAIISAFNEGDIISAVIGHLVENGIDVYLIDNLSTDDTIEQANQWLGRGLLKIESFPKDPASNHEASNQFDWTAILRRKEELANELRADWFIHHDADEVRESPWPAMNLKEAIRWVDTLGYNCIDFRVLNFPPIDDGFKQGDDPRSYFTFYEDGAECDKVQLKCWKFCNTGVSLIPSGGHEVFFEGKRVFPIQFLLRHYPIRGQKHGRRKIFTERKNRFLMTERLQGWHRQYEQFADESYDFIRAATELRPFSLHETRLELMLPEKQRRDLDNLHAQKQELESHARNLEREREKRRKYVADLEKERQDLKKHADELEQERNALRRHAENLDQERESLTKHAVNLQAERDELKRHAENLKQERESLKGHATNLEEERQQLRKHAANLEGERVCLCEHVAKLETERGDLKRYTANLESEREELRMHTANLELTRDRIQQELIGIRDAHDIAKRHVADLEYERDKMRLQIESLETLCQALEREKRASGLELSELRNSRSWRWTAPFRRLFDMLKV